MLVLVVDVANKQPERNARPFVPFSVRPASSVATRIGTRLKAGPIHIHAQFTFELQCPVLFQLNEFHLLYPLDSPVAIRNLLFTVNYNCPHRAVVLTERFAIPPIGEDQA